MIRINLEDKTYSSPNDFALDMRRVVGNCLRYNYTKASANLRSEAKKYLAKFESEFSKSFPQCQLAFSDAKEVLKTIEDVCKIVVPPNRLVVFSFIDPIHAYFGGQYPEM